MLDINSRSTSMNAWMPFSISRQTDKARDMSAFAWTRNVLWSNVIWLETSFNVHLKRNCWCTDGFECCWDGGQVLLKSTQLHLWRNKLDLEKMIFGKTLGSEAVWNIFDGILTISYPEQAIFSCKASNVCGMQKFPKEMPQESNPNTIRAFCLSSQICLVHTYAGLLCWRCWLTAPATSKP